ncbi:MAG TPA: protease complex subunit PrcB family protein [Gemmataceae bacterium]|jgi:hypothetical protein
MWTALMVSLVLAAPPGSKDEKDRDLKILARGAWPVRHEKPTQLVLRNAEELALAHGVAPKDAKEKRFQADVTADVVSLLKVKAIDWDKQMLVVVTAGMKRTGGYRVEILSLPVKDGTLTVRWKLHSPAPGDIVTQAITYPAEMVLVERVAAVKFDPPAKAEGKDK